MQKVTTIKDSAQARSHAEQIKGMIYRPSLVEEMTVDDLCDRIFDAGFAYGRDCCAKSAPTD